MKIYRLLRRCSVLQHEFEMWHNIQYINLCLKKVNHLTTNDKFNSDCTIPIILQQILLSEYVIRMLFNFSLHLFSVRTLPSETVRLWQWQTKQ